MQKCPSWFEAAPAASKADYYHDHRGEYHDPNATIIPDFGDNPIVNEAIRAEYMKEKKDSSEELKRLKMLLRVIQNDPRALTLLASLISNCTAYFQLVVNHQIAKKLLARDPSDRRADEHTRADQLRRLKHNALMDDMKALGRYVRQHYGPEGDIKPHTEEELPLSLLYTETATDRATIGVWALRFADGLARLSSEEKHDILENFQRPSTAIAAE